MLHGLEKFLFFSLRHTLPFYEHKRLFYWPKNELIEMMRAALFLFLIIATASANAACPDLPKKCNTLTYGWQGTCLKGLWCKKCGSKHCPEQPMFKSSSTRSIAILDGSGAQSCRDDLIDDKWKPNGGSVCSVPDAVGGYAGMAHLIFGKNACVEHDICYDMKGMNQKLCDTMFLDNMKQACSKYYFDHLGSRGAIVALNATGYSSCKTAANLFYKAVRLKGHDSFYPSHCEVDGPPKLNTSIYLAALFSNDRIAMKSYKNQSDKDGKIKVCLRNKTNQWKGMHFKSASKPKYVARKKNNISCGHYWPGKKMFYFWEKGKSGKSLSGPPVSLDLHGYTDYKIIFDWYEE